MALIIVPVFQAISAEADAEFQAFGVGGQSDFERKSIEYNMGKGSRTISLIIGTEYVLLALPIIPSNTYNNLFFKGDVFHLNSTHYYRFFVFDDNVFQ